MHKLVLIIGYYAISAILCTESPALSFQQKLHAPDFFLHVPREHFAGVSSPMPSLAEARKAAISDVVRQILRSISVEYEHHLIDRVSGNVRGQGLKRIVDDRLSGFAKGIVLKVEQNIVDQKWSRDKFGSYVYFALVRYPEKMIAEMRRLSKGARVIASVVRGHGNEINIKVTEVNGVLVVLKSADIMVCKRNRFSKAISLFVWKIPSKAKHRSTMSINPIKLCGNSANIQLHNNNFRKNLTDYLLGADIDIITILNGYDEIGRFVSVKIKI